MKGISNQVREIRRVLIHVLCGSGTLEISSKDCSHTWLYLKFMCTASLIFKDEIKKILHPIQFESINHNSFRRVFFPHGLHHSVQRVLNGTLETKSRSSAKRENPLMIERLMKYCEVILRISWKGF